MRLSTNEQEIGPLFTVELFRNQNIPEPTFSFGLTGYTEDESSFVDFGKPDEKRVKDKIINTSTTITLSMNDDFFWSTSLQAIRFNQTADYALLGDPYTILDTGSSHLLVPSNLYQQLID